MTVDVDFSFPVWDFHFYRDALIVLRSVIADEAIEMEAGVSTEMDLRLSLYKLDDVTFDFAHGR